MAVNLSETSQPCGQYYSAQVRRYKCTLYQFNSHILVAGPIASHAFRVTGGVITANFANSELLLNFSMKNPRNYFCPNRDSKPRPLDSHQTDKTVGIHKEVSRIHTELQSRVEGLTHIFFTPFPQIFSHLSLHSPIVLLTYICYDYCLYRHIYVCFPLLYHKRKCPTREFNLRLSTIPQDPIDVYLNNYQSHSIKYYKHSYLRDSTCTRLFHLSIICIGMLERVQITFD